MKEIVLPWPPKELTPNFKRSHHWTAYRKPTKAYRETCWALTKQARIGVPAGDVPVLLTVAFHPPDRRRRDDDGIIGAFKAGRDGIADALMIDDHAFRPTYHFGEPSPGGKIIVVLA